MQPARPAFRIASCVLAAIACTGQAVAQTTNCMAMGPDMVNCNTIGPSGESSTTNCMAMGGGMATCNTTGGPVPGTSPNQGHFLTRLSAALAEGKERSVRKHVGHMLADGDCQGASRYALANGSVELGLKIQQSCQSAPAANPGSLAQPTLAEVVNHAVAELRKEPFAADGKPGTVRLEALNGQIFIALRLPPSITAMSAEMRQGVADDLCGEDVYKPLLQKGASVHVAFLSIDNRDLGAVLATKQGCGF